jgi:hypothetical protein
MMDRRGVVRIIGHDGSVRPNRLELDKGVH